MAKLGLRLLGGFLLQADARPRALPARKAQALLAYLAVRAGRAHARETLTGLLWGDVAERHWKTRRLRREPVGQDRTRAIRLGPEGGPLVLASGLHFAGHPAMLSANT